MDQRAEADHFQFGFQDCGPWGHEVEDEKLADAAIEEQQ